MDIEIEGLSAVKQSLGPEFSAALQIFACCTGRVVVSGVGKSGLVGRKIAATLSSTGTPAFFLHPVEGAHGDMGMIRQEDVVLAISNSGETDELNTLVPSFRSLGVKIVSMTSSHSSTLACLSDISLLCRVPREACPYGLAPTSSTTASLALGDALAVCLIRWKSFQEDDFRRYHPGGSLGQRLALDIQTIMHRDNLPCVRSKTTLAEALQVLNSGGLGTVVIVDSDQRLQGILTDGDVRRMVCKGVVDFQQPIEKWMIRSPKTAGPDQSAGEVMDIMESGAITVLPIVDCEQVLIGLVHLHDLLGKGKFKFSSGISSL
ncbi:MAG: KpsF/GutQ family sugar-phosphate isomerase [Desulfovibrionales bacterium]